MMKLKYTEWSQISIKKYYELEELNNLEDSQEKEIAIVACLCECSTEEISKLPYSEFLNLKNQLDFLGKFTFDTNKDLKKIEISGRKYKVCRDFSKFTTAQYIDFQNLYAKHDLKSYYGLLLSTFVIPENAKVYNEGYDVLEEAEFIYSNLDICRANQLMFFFRKRWHNLMIVTVNYLRYLARKRKDTGEVWKKILEETQNIPGWGALI